MQRGPRFRDSKRGIRVHHERHDGPISYEQQRKEIKGHAYPFDGRLAHAGAGLQTQQIEQTRRPCRMTVTLLP